VDPYIRRSEWREAMSDILFLVLSIAFFAATIGMAYLFERLREHK
jgi:hypothetical protein